MAWATHRIRPNRQLGAWDVAGPAASGGGLLTGRACHKTRDTHTHASTRTGPPTQAQLPTTHSPNQSQACARPRARPFTYLVAPAHSGAVPSQQPLAAAAQRRRLLRRRALQQPLQPRLDAKSPQEVRLRRQRPRPGGNQKHPTLVRMSVRGGGGEGARGRTGRKGCLQRKQAGFLATHSINTASE